MGYWLYNNVNTLFWTIHLKMVKMVNLCLCILPQFKLKKNFLKCWIDPKNYIIVGKGMRFVQSLNQCLNFGFPLINCVTLGNILNLSEQPQFYSLQNGNDNTFLAELLNWLNEIMHAVQSNTWPPKQIILIAVIKIEKSLLNLSTRSLVIMKRVMWVMN